MEIDIEVEEAEKILAAVAEQKNRGIRILSLCARTNIGYTAVHSFLEQHKDYFEKIKGKPRYRLNRRGVFGGDAGLMLDSLKRERIQLWLVLGITIFVSVSISFLAVVFAPNF
jgi:hypothetical protein